MTYLNQFLPLQHAIIYKAWDMARYNKRLVQGESFVVKCVFGDNDGQMFTRLSLD